MREQFCFRRSLILLACLALLSSCSGMRGKKDGAIATVIGENQPASEALPKVLSKKDEDDESEDNVAEFKAADIENQTIDDVIRIEEPNTQTLYDNSRYDFP